MCVRNHRDYETTVSRDAIIETARFGERAAR